MKTRDVLAVFNRGRISRLALARSDVSRVALSAEVQTNWMPRTLGAMSLRPGLEYIGSHLGDGCSLPFVVNVDDTALIDLTAGQMQIWEHGTDLVTRVSVSSAVTNGEFTSDLTGWTDADESTAASTWSAGSMKLVGTGYFSAKRRQEVTVAGGDTAKVHALRIVIGRGPVLLRVGSTAGDDDIFRQAVLRTGTHSIAFTPGGNFWIEFSSSRKYSTLVDSVAVEAAGAMTIPTPWPDVAACRRVRWAKSGEVVYCACEGYQQRRIERRDNNSWSIVLYEADDGPFLPENTEFISLTPSATTGDITLTASRELFEAGHVGAIFRISSQGQFVEATLAAAPLFSDSIRVTGVGGSTSIGTSARNFRRIITGTWVGTITLQRSIDEEGSWEDVATFTGNTNTTYDDALDNVIAYYRIGFKAGEYTSGTANVELQYANGSITGTVRITGVTDADTASAVVLKTLGRDTASEVWAEGIWSEIQGWPSATAIWEGRLWWLGDGRVQASVSDGFTLFDPDTIGDAGPINRRIGDGSSADVQWVLPLQRLIAGTTEAEYSIRSNSFDEPVTPSNYNVKAPSSKGAAPVAAVTADGRGYFVGRSGTQVYESQFDPARYEFQSLDVSLLVPEIGDGGFARLGVQQTPDMRLHAVRADGTVGVLVRDAAEDVLCWVDVETNGEIKDVVTLPSQGEDRVFYRVQREIDGGTVYYHERWALAADCVGGAVNQQADSFMVGTETLDGLDHLEGAQVVVWGDGVDMGTAVVLGGAIAGLTADNWCVGLAYDAQYQSAKLAGQSALGLSLTQRSRINKLGLILADTHYQGLQYGPSFDVLDDLPLVEDGEATDTGTVWESYDKDMVEFPGDWSNDNRICLVASAPRPCTVLAAVLNIDRQDNE